MYFESANHGPFLTPFLGPFESLQDHHDRLTDTTRSAPAARRNPNHQPPPADRIGHLSHTAEVSRFERHVPLHLRRQRARRFRRPDRRGWRDQRPHPPRGRPGRLLRHRRQRRRSPRHGRVQDHAQHLRRPAQVEPGGLRLHRDPPRQGPARAEGFRRRRGWHSRSQGANARRGNVPGLQEVPETYA